MSATKSSVAFFDAFRSKLEELGYIEGKNLKLDVRRAEDDYARLPSLATELVALSPNVITDAVAALQPSEFFLDIAGHRLAVGDLE